MRFTFTIVLIFAALLTRAQVICLSPLQPEETKPGSTVKGILKKNQVSLDSLTMLVNAAVIKGIKALRPGSSIRIADTHFARLLADSSELQQLLTTSHLEAVNGLQGLKKINARVNGGATFYEGKNFNPGAILGAMEVMRQSGADYFIFLNEFDSHSAFSIHYEIYDKNFEKVYGDKFSRKHHLSRDMYFNTFLYYFNSFMEGFNSELVKHL